MKRMDICWCNLEERGSVQGGLRPCVIISNDKACQVSPTLIVVPITTKSKKKMPTHMYLNNVLKYESTVLFEQIITVNKEQIQDKITELPQHLTKKADEKIMFSLGIPAFA